MIHTQSGVVSKFCVMRSPENYFELISLPSNFVDQPNVLDLNTYVSKKLIQEI